MSIIIALDEITTGTPGENISASSKVTFAEQYQLGDFALDDAINKRAALQAFNFGLPISIPSGSDYPVVVDMATETYENVTPGFVAQFEILVDGNFETATKTKPVSDCSCEKNFTDASRTTLTSLTIYAHEDPDNPGKTIDEMQLIIR